MPTSEEVLGFSNQWYKAALETATGRDLDDVVSIPVVAAPPFIGAKIEAFRNRGQGVYYKSPDLEDIITVLNGRPEVVDDFNGSPTRLHTYTGRAFEGWLETPEFENALPGHLQHIEASTERTRIIENRMQEIIQRSEICND